MKESTKRAIVRWLHIILAIPIVGYIYSPFDVIHYYATPTRYVFVPTIVLSGLWLWEGSRRPPIVFGKAGTERTRDVFLKMYASLRTTIRV
jgi:hypothetical protein